MNWKRWPILKEAYRQGGIDSFALAEADIMEAMEDTIERRADERLKDKVRDLLSIIDERSVISIIKGQVYIGGEVALKAQLENLKQEAAFLRASQLWQVIKETLKRVAEESMFTKSESLVDLQKGKSILFTLKTQQNLLDLLENLEM